MDVATFQAAGLYDPEAPAAADRLALLPYLDGLGATVAEIAEADAEGVLFALSAYRAAFVPVQRLPLADVAQRAATTQDRIRRMLLAQGLTVDDDSLLPAFVVDDAIAFALGTSLFGEEATLAFTQVMGASVARIIDAAISLFYGEISSTMAAGTSELERARINENAGSVFALLPSVIDHLLEQRFRLDSVRAASTRADAVGQTATVAVGFVDLVGSTAWAGQLSLKEHALALARFESAAWDIATEYGGRVVKLIGDEAMIVAATTETVCRIAVELCATVGADPGLPGARAGIAFGEVTSRSGDFVGPLVNLAARSVKVAAEGSVVMTAEARDQLGTDTPWRLVEAGTPTLRGISTPVPLYAVATGAADTGDQDDR
ncbi:MAG TPA: adenylate/guanylate cyclase domain-containing protein [Acidimicrobiales bacterium]|nr:adenylate/guanylate cyclase domain-containing protein [Acidimicrobiales bacterium]